MGTYGHSLKYCAGLGPRIEKGRARFNCFPRLSALQVRLDSALYFHTHQGVAITLYELSISLLRPVSYLFETVFNLAAPSCDSTLLLRDPCRLVLLSDIVKPTSIMLLTLF